LALVSTFFSELACRAILSSKDKFSVVLICIGGRARTGPLLGGGAAIDRGGPRLGGGAGGPLAPPRGAGGAGIDAPMPAVDIYGGATGLPRPLGGGGIGTLGATYDFTSLTSASSDSSSSIMAIGCD